MIKNFVIAGLLVCILVVVGYLSEQSSETPGVPNDVVCAQVITPALDPETGDIVEFPTPCDVPEGWMVVQNEVPDLDLDLDLEVQ